MKTHRSFIALFPPREIIDKLLVIQSRMKLESKNVRWEKEYKFHFTLQFWENQTDEWLNTIHKELNATCSQIPKFKIVITKIGCFPNRYSPKIFWIGSEPNENDKLLQLAGSIQSIAEQFGFKPENKPFHPHITVGRGKGKISSGLIQNLETVTFHPIEFLCSDVRIMESHLASTGSTYTTLFTIPLK